MGDTFAAIIIGIIGGFAGGLLGVGGGNIYIPAMVLLLDENQHMAQGASLAAIIATGIVGGVTHLRRGNVDTQAAALVAPAAIVMGFGAAFLANALDAEVLRRIFAVVGLGFGGSMVYGAVRSARSTARETEQG